MIQLKSDGKTYGSLKKVLTQYELYGITREQLKLAVKKITENEVDDSYPPAAVILWGNLSLSPISILTGVSGADHHVMTLTTVAATTTTVTTTTTTMTTTAVVNDKENNNKDDDNRARNKGGRPIGTTNMARIKKEKMKKAILVEASTRLIKVQKEATNGILPRNGWSNILRQLEVEYDLDINALNAHNALLKDRGRMKNPIGLGELQKSPMLEIELLLVDYILKLSEIGMPLNRGEVIELTTSMIAGQPIEEKVMAWKKKHIRYNDSQAVLGTKWYNNFMNRDQDRLTRKKALIRDVRRETWVMYDNFKLMYDCIYDQMVCAGIATKHPEKVFRNRGGQILDEEEVFGLATEYVLTHPHMIVYANKTGSNTNQKMMGITTGNCLLLELISRRLVHWDWLLTITSLYWSSWWVPASQSWLL